VRWGKRKNTQGSAKSVGLPVVPFQYGLSLFVCLSKWFTFFVCPSVTVRLHGRLLRLLLTVCGFAFGRVFSTKLPYEAVNFKVTKNCHTKPFPPPDAKPLLAVVVSSVVLLVVILIAVKFCKLLSLQ